MDGIMAPGMDFQGLFEASPNPYLVLDRRLHIAGANRAYLLSVKRELSDIVGRWAWDAFPADAETVSQAIASFERVIRTRQPDTMALLRFDVPRPEAEGGGFMERYWSITHVPVLDAAGEVSAVLQHPIDVTELQHLRGALERAGDAAAPNLVPAHSGIFGRAQSVYESNLALQAERDRLTGMFAQAPGFMAVLRGREHRFELANPSYMRLVGHRPVIGRTVAEALPDAGEQGYLGVLDRVFDSGEAYTANGAAYAVQVAPNDPAAERFVDFVFQPIRDGDGRVTGIFVQGSDVTDRTLGEAALRASEARNRQILDSAIDYGIIATDLDGRVTRWNEGARRVLGWTEEEMLGQPADRFFTPEDVENGQVRKEMRAALETGHGKDERWHQRKGGERFWAIGEMTALKEDDGATVGFVKVLRDRTEQRLAEDALRQSEARLRALNADLERQVIARSQVRGQIWQVSPDLLGVCDAAGRFESSNPAWHAVLGWSEAEIAATPFIELVHPEDREPTRDAFRRLRNGEPVLRFENRYRCKDGGYRWLSWVAAPEEGRFYCSARDVTEEREQAAKLAVRTMERDRLWELSTDIMLRCRFDGTVVAVNPAWTETLGWAETDLVGASLFRFIHPDDVERTTQGAARLSEGHSFPRFENRYLCRDGSYRWINWSTSSAGGLITAVGRDVTAEKEQAEALANAEEQLRQSQKMEAVGQLTGGLAHDFNNLLTGITGSLELLQTRVAQGRIKEIDRYANAAREAAKRAAALTHRLLAFSRRQTLDPKVTDVNRLVSGMQELIERTMGPEIAVEPVAGAGLWATRVDPGQLENALLNLCINARDAMPDGGRLAIETGNRWLDERAARELGLLPGQYVSLCVNDNGAGMAPGVAARAFEPFYTTKPIGKGTGLGLSMIYGFARQSGGQARICSEVGRGTTVCLYLPRHLGEADEAESAPDLAGAPRAGQGETVLVVDDEPAVRMLVTEALEDLGYTAIEAADGAAGLKVLHSEARIDLLVTDVGLPGGMNGRQVADAARTARPDLKVLFITGYAENAVLGQGHLEPGMHILTKPFAMEALASRMQDLIAGG